MDIHVEDECEMSDAEKENLLGKLNDMAKQLKEIKGRLQNYITALAHWGVSKLKFFTFRLSNYGIPNQ